MDPLKAKLKGISGGIVLDVGTGWGAFVEHLIDIFNDYEHIIGIDYSERLVNMAIEKYGAENIRFEVMDAEHMKFDDNSIDTAVISYTLHHLKNIPAVLHEMMRVLKPGGLFILREMFIDKSKEVEYSHHHLHHWRAEIDRINGIEHNEVMTKDEILSVVKELKLQNQESFIEYEAVIEPGNNEAIKELLEEIDISIQKIKDNPELDYLTQKGEYFKNLFKNKGCEFDPTLNIIGRK